MNTSRDWTKKYLDLLIRGEDEEMFALKWEHFPERFYKYKALSVNTISSLESNTIWLAEIASLNDPFECSVQFDNDECLRHYYADKKFQQGFQDRFGFPLSQQEIGILTSSEKPYLEYCRICSTKNIEVTITQEQQLQRIQVRFNAILEETNRDIKVSCFTEHNDSLLMWPHYADQHQGICLEYDFMEQNHIRPFLQPVIYSDKVHKIGLFEELTMLRKIGSTLVKSVEWSYEDEWRLTVFKQAEVMPLTVAVPDPKAVYLGTRFEQNDSAEKIKFLALMQAKGIPVFRMTKHPNEYKLLAT